MLVMVADRLRDQVALRHRAMQDDVGADRRVGLHDFPVFAFQAIRRKQHAIRRADLAHIVQPRGHGGGLLFVFGQATGLRQRHA
ncbi:hypothetical protein D3C72_1569110 [compost metagenome]